MSNRIGNRPRFPLPNQRFDKGDADNISKYYEEIIARFTGSIYGQAWGCVSNPEFEIVSVTDPFTGTLTYIRPKRCVLLHSVPADGTLNTTTQDRGPWNATLTLFDPANPGQSVQSLLTGSAFSANQRPWILFRRQETNTNTGNKAYWDTASNTEEVDAAPLQRTEYVAFKLSVTYSSNDRADGWYRCAYIDSWDVPASAQTPVIVPIHWMDSQYYADSTPPVQGTRVASAFAHPAAPNSVNVTGFDPQSEMPELAKLLHWIVGKLGQHYTANVRQVTDQNASLYGLKPGAFVNLIDTEGWLQRPVRGLLEIEAYLNTLQSITLPELQAELITQQQQVARVATTPRLLHTLYVRPVDPVPGGSTAWDNYTFEVTSLTTTGSAPVSSNNSFSPTLVPYTGAALSSNNLGYRITTTLNTRKLLNVELVTGSNFVVTSLSVSLEADAALTTQWPSELPPIIPKYDINSPAVMPPSAYVRSNVTFDTTEEFGVLNRIVIVIHVYGRNV